jgi:DNA mismatch endonuclease (patch repair protein)
MASPLSAHHDSDARRGQASSASSRAVRRAVESNRRKATLPDVHLESRLHGRGLRIREDRRVEAAVLLVRPDILSPKASVAVFLDGCFWHRCPEHGTLTKKNAGSWSQKPQRNGDSEPAADAALAGSKWIVVPRWEHEAPGEAFPRIERALSDTR